MSGAFEIAGIHARKTTAFGESPAVEVEIRLEGGAAGRAVLAAGGTGGNFSGVVQTEDDLVIRGGRADEMVEYVNTILNTALKSGDAYNQEAIESLLKSAGETGSRYLAKDSVLPAVALAASRARTAQMRAG